jgi:hypothetical protein
MPEVSYFSRKLYSDRLRTIGAGHKEVALALPGFTGAAFQGYPRSRSFPAGVLAKFPPMEAVRKRNRFRTVPSEPCPENGKKNFESETACVASNWYLRFSFVVI